MKGRMIMCSTIISQIVSDMFDRTDRDGVLILPGWPEVGDTDGGGRFYKCWMNWDLARASEIPGDIEEICLALEYIGSWQRDNGGEQDIRPEFDTEGMDEDGLCAVGLACDIWDTVLGGPAPGELDPEELSALAREYLGSDINAVGVLTRMRRYVSAVRLSAPPIILVSELYYFVQAFVLNQACEYMAMTDLLARRRSKAFSGDDMLRIYQMLREDTSILPAPQAEELCPEGPLLSGSCQEARDKTKALLERLSELERRVIEKRFGLLDGRPRKPDETALELGIPTGAVRAIETAVLRELRHL